MCRSPRRLGQTHWPASRSGPTRWRDDGLSRVGLLDLDAEIEGTAGWFAARQRRGQPALLAQQGAYLHGGIVDLDLEHRVSGLQLPAGGLGSLGGVELRFEMAVDD